MNKNIFDFLPSSSTHFSIKMWKFFSSNYRSMYCVCVYAVCVLSTLAASTVVVNVYLDYMAYKKYLFIW